MLKKIKYNRIKCVHCSDIIESETVHDFRRCSCGSVAVDGGKEYARRLAQSKNDFIEMIEYEDDADE